uniref:Uncharacterized protein n=1 Tax=Picea glauca TaxID=3330 RepID=A0A117NIF3_PICGL|nr:hypothetical protein ABT39_MTgene3080 [Picea glauca]
MHCRSMKARSMHYELEEAGKPFSERPLPLRPSKVFLSYFISLSPVRPYGLPVVLVPLRS